MTFSLKNNRLFNGIDEKYEDQLWPNYVRNSFGDESNIYSSEVSH